MCDAKQLQSDLHDFAAVYLHLESCHFDLFPHYPPLPHHTVTVHWYDPGVLVWSVHKQPLIND